MQEILYWGNPMPAKDYKAILTRYHFKDRMGHLPENCIDFRDLIKEREIHLKIIREMTFALNTLGAESGLLSHGGKFWRYVGR
jgi:hypothetical protein